RLSTTTVDGKSKFVRGRRASREHAFTRAYPVAPFDRHDEHPAITDDPRARGPYDRFHDFVDQVVGHDYLDFHPGQQTAVVLVGAIYRAVALLLGVSANFRDCYARDRDSVQRCRDRFDFIWAHDAFDQRHSVLELSRVLPVVDS